MVVAVVDILMLWFTFFLSRTTGAFQYLPTYDHERHSSKWDGMTGLFTELLPQDELAIQFCCYIITCKGFGCCSFNKTHSCLQFFTFNKLAQIANTREQKTTLHYHNAPPLAVASGRRFQQLRSVMATGVWLMGFRTYRYTVFLYTLNFE